MKPFIVGLFRHGLAFFRLLLIKRRSSNAQIAMLSNGYYMLGVEPCMTPLSCKKTKIPP